MKPTPRPTPWLALLLAVGAAALADAAFTAGGTAFTKRVETNLLAEPNPMASSTGRIGFAHQLKVEQVQGAWLHVSEGATAGWVFSGNVATAKPEETKGLTDIPINAAATTATAASRPMMPASKAYATQHNLANPSSDLEWMIKEASAVMPADVEAYLKSNKKGEYR